MSRYYFAYGSNLHPLRLTERIHSARLISSAELAGYRLTFDKHGQDGSSKCNLQQSGRPSDRVHGAIYQIASKHKPQLDEFEGLGAGYIDQEIELSVDGRRYRCFSYFAQAGYITDLLKPYEWYRQLVLEGARYLQFPSAYVAQIAAVASVSDPDIERELRHWRLIERMSSP